MDKVNDEFTTYCNECDWEEVTIGLPYQFCQKCGHINIGFEWNKLKEAIEKTGKPPDRSI